jgi:cytoskeletal protein RodZ
VGQFGDKFRKAREKKEISLDDVSNVTKISARMLQAIEEEHFDQLPGGVFNKGFIRAYARHVGLNDEEAVNEYLACLRQRQIDAQAVWEPNAGADKRPQVAAHQIAANQVVASKVSRTQPLARPTEDIRESTELPGLQLPRIGDVRPARRKFAGKSNPLPWRPVVITILLLVAVGVLWQRRMRHARAEEAAAGAVTVTPQPSPSTPAAVPAPATAQATPTNARETKSVPASEKASVAGIRSNAPPGKPVITAKNTANEDDNTPAPDAANSAPVSKAPARFRLVIHADENSWIAVTADGQPVSHETLIAPADAAIRANREVVARVGNAAGVSFVWNGQEFQPQGAEAEVKTFLFDENGMHELATTPSPSQPH